MSDSSDCSGDDFFALPPSWAWVKLGDLQPEFQNGLASRGERGGSPTVVLRLADISNGIISLKSPRSLLLNEVSKSRYSATDTDILIIRVNGSTDLVGQFIACNLRGIVYCDHFIRMHIEPKLIDQRFLALLGSSWIVRRQIERFFVSTAGQKTVNQRHISSIVLPLPPRAEQERIVTAIEEQFSRREAGVAALGRACQKLKRMRAAALSGLLQDEDGTEFPEVELGDVLLRGRYGTSTKCSVDGKGLPVLRIPNVQSGRIAFSDLKYAIDLSVNLEGAQIAEGDILIIRTNGSRSLIGRAAVVLQTPYPAAFASYLIQLRMDRSAVDPAYLVTALAAPSLRTKIEALAATTAGQYNISLDKLRSLRIPLPSLSQQSRFLAATEGLLSIADHLDGELAHSLTKASQLRSAILSRAFTGRLIPHNITDESASALLERIAEERASSNGHWPARARNPQGVRTEARA